MKFYKENGSSNEMQRERTAKKLQIKNKKYQIKEEKRKYTAVSYRSSMFGSGFPCSRPVGQVNDKKKRIRLKKTIVKKY
jgi:hypothetical protein